MKKSLIIKLLGVILLSTMALSCSNEMHMFLPEGPEGPQGPQGENGLSAYELWLEELKNGNINWNGDTDLAGFFLYFKGQDGRDGQDGEDGQDGQDGEDGQNGKSAYELWKEIAETGDMDDPKNSGQKWPKDKTTEADFWYYLTGADGGNGQSAYELWVIEVGKGLENPHKPGTDWDKNKTTTDDFWEYLRGSDGSVVVLGSPNVIVDVFVGAEGEYVNPQNGSVTYTVYDKGGNKAKEGTEVKDLPAALNNNIYVVDANGKITVPKEDLPLDATINQRSGSCQVKFAGETEWYESASNTVVPNRVQVRLYTVSYRNPVLVYQTFTTIRVQIQRKTSDSGSWEGTPGTLYNHAGTTIKTYKLSGKDVDPKTDIPTNGVLIRQDGRNFADAGSSWDMAFQMWNRDVIETNATWSGTQEYYGISATAYGETLYANSVIDLHAPIQKIPMIQNVKAQQTGDNLYRMSAEFMTDVNDDYLYSDGYNYSGKNSLDNPYLSVQLDANARNNKCLVLKFTKGSGDDQTTIVCKPASVNENICKTDIGGGVPVGSTVTLECTNHLFANRGAIGKLEFDESGTGLVIKLNNGSTIPVTIVSSID